MNSAPLPPVNATGKLHNKNVTGGSSGIVENTQYIQLYITKPLIITI